ncbi:MAG: FISUMP domain-containing protein [Bacteroidota bacterium]
MQNQAPRSQKLYLTYHSVDRQYLLQLHKHLSGPEEMGWIEVWHDQVLEAGTDLQKARQAAREQADMVLLLISADFLADDNLQAETKWALDRQKQGQGQVLPIIVRECLWQYAPFASLAILPIEGNALVDRHWDSLDDACVHIVSKLMERLQKDSQAASSAVQIQDGYFTDPRDGQRYPVAEFQGRTWLCKNLNYPLAEGFRYYQDDPANGEPLGALYTWAAAQEACPPGWRLANAEDWQSLIDYFGSPHYAYKHLIPSGDSPLNMVPAGKYSMHSKDYVLQDQGFGFYWSAESVNYEQAIYYMFDKGMASLRRIAVDKQTGASCRYVLDE